MLCSTEDCDREAERNGMCWACLKRRVRGKRAEGPKGAPKRPGHELWNLREAALAYANASDVVEEDEKAFARASDNLRKAAGSYASRLQAQNRGRKGGIERARCMSAEERSEAAKRAVMARWAKKRAQDPSHT